MGKGAKPQATPPRSLCCAGHPHLLGQTFVGRKTGPPCQTRRARKPWAACPPSPVPPCWGACRGRRRGLRDSAWRPRGPGPGRADRDRQVGPLQGAAPAAEDVAVLTPQPETPAGPQTIESVPLDVAASVAEDVADPPAHSQTPDVPAAPAAEPATPFSPRFDLVRVDAAGSALIAGQAASLAEVTLALDGEPVETVMADAAGQFVAMLALAPSERPRLLSLRAVLPDGAEVGGEQTVLIAPFAGDAVAAVTIEPALPPDPPPATRADPPGVERPAAARRSSVRGPATATRLPRRPRRWPMQRPTVHPIRRPRRRPRRRRKWRKAALPRSARPRPA